MTILIFGNRSGVRYDHASPIIGYPESFQRTSTADEEDIPSGSTSGWVPPSESTSSTMPQGTRTEYMEDEGDMPRRFSRSGVMKLENILNAASIGYDPHPWPRSHSASPVQTQFAFEPSSPSSRSIARSQSPEESSSVKKKKVKMHRCPECQKDFPRPSGLRTHMNMHTKEKPFTCTFPGCSRAFSVVSNAKRHMRTHGVGLVPDDVESAPVPYVVGFEAPVVVPPVEPDTASHKSPVRLRWIYPGGDGRWIGSENDASIPDMGVMPQTSTSFFNSG
ncbi:hypothetical protein HYPSUDRAFT_48371 [Hypholoma sublateritium FD-334 SS-4]|uniref:C2H2-type domain-containing protein n=1 Tax=Hypholoma sublateritium (strain FD-334 SS-4) TaxID=945553 RepID=A0A0D2NFH8_HYPSF|nr:hypothetical protein HYPSUDRAFT_48371 [Hypholoma sublateritium FD-334 SS-4]